MLILFVSGRPVERRMQGKRARDYFVELPFNWFHCTFCGLQFKYTKHLSRHLNSPGHRDTVAAALSSSNPVYHPPPDLVTRQSCRYSVSAPHDVDRDARPLLDGGPASPGLASGSDVATIPIDHLDVAVYNDDFDVDRDDPTLAPPRIPLVDEPTEGEERGPFVWETNDIEDSMSQLNLSQSAESHVYAFAV